MKNFLVIGNPISHSLSPKLHNYWIKVHNINAIYEKRKLVESDLKNLIAEVKLNKIVGINITVPFKKSIVPLVDELSESANKTQSVNTIYKKNEKIIGDNTDIGGFEKALKHVGYNVSNKKVFILGAGGVSASIIYSLEKMGVKNISLSNRTKEKALELKKMFPSINIVNWGDHIDFDMIINATSLGLNKTDRIELNFNDNYKNKFFYDIIYNPSKTKFLTTAETKGSDIENGKLMFIYQAQLAFEIWHGVKPKIDTETIKFLND